MEFRPCVLGDQGDFDDPDGVTTDGPNEVWLLRKGTRPEAHFLGPCVFRYGLVLIAVNRLGRVDRFVDFLSVKCSATRRVVGC